MAALTPSLVGRILRIPAPNGLRRCRPVIRHHDRYTTAWNDHDPRGVTAAFAEGGTVSDPATDGTLVGEEISEWVEETRGGSRTFDSGQIGASPTGTGCCSSSGFSARPIAYGLLHDYVETHIVPMENSKSTTSTW
jgi:hypothetical protein